MTEPHLTPSDIEPWLQFIEERERRLHDMEDSFEVAEEHQVEFQAVYGICVQALRFAGAYVVLHRVGRAREAVAVARQALEHSLTAQWAHSIESGPDQLIESYHHSRDRAFRAVMEYLGTPQEEIDSALGSTMSSGKRLLSVTKRIEQIDFNATFKTAYIQQSQILHVTSETATAFLRLGSDKEFILLTEANDPNELLTVHHTAMAAMFVSWVLESLRLGTPGLAELDRLSNELKLPLNLRD